MRRTLLALGLALLALGTIAPVVEAFAPCAEPCVDENPGGQCDRDQCCSCCVHVRLVTTDLQAAPDPLAPASSLAAAPTHLPVAADPREILHVPKPATA